MKKTFLLTLMLALAAPALAAVPSSSSRVEYTGNDVKVAFTFTFVTYAASHVEVYVAGVKQVAGFTVALNANQSSSPGGTVTFDSPPASLATVRIQRTVPLTQDTVYTPYSAFPAKTTEKALDRTFMATQQLQRQRDDDVAAQDARDDDQDVQIALGPGVANGNNVPVTATGSTTARPLAERAADVANVKDYGAAGDGVTDDTAAIAAAVAACGGNTRGVLLFPSGTYRTNTISVPTWCALRGEGMLNTHLRPTNNNNSVIKLDRAAGSSYGDNVEISGLHIWGYGAGTGHGIEGTGTYASAVGPSGLVVRDVYVDAVGGNGLHFGDGLWYSRFERVSVSNVLGHGFYVNASYNTLVFDSCYARGIPTAGKAGWRILEGRATLINCNGVDSDGDYWGVFGAELADGDARDGNAFVHLIGGNVEAAEVRGLWFKRNAQWQVDSTSFVAHSNGTSEAIYFNNFNNNNPGIIGGAVTFAGTWANTFPLHAKTAPGMIKWGLGASNVWDEDAAYSTTMANLYGIDGEGLLRISGGVVLGTAGAAAKLKQALTGTATWDAPSIADGAMTSTTVTVTGAALGDTVTVSHSIAVPAGALLVGAVTAADTVTVTLFNKTGGPLDLASGTLRAVVWKH